MAASDGRYFPALDHVRALAAFMVFCWHFIHIRDGQQVDASAWGLSLLTEGHTGVALFMCLSGYLFARLIDHHPFHLGRFYANRGWRLAPLLLLVMGLVGLQKWWNGENLLAYAVSLFQGLLLPTWPNGGWSITVELHFYLLLPGLLYLARRQPAHLLLVLLLAWLVRVMLFVQWGQVHEWAYGTLGGRIDQFVMGMLAWFWRERWPSHGKCLLAVAALFLLGFHWFDSHGGFYGNGGYPSPSAVWIWLPALEGLAYASGIAWYDQHAPAWQSAAARAWARVGQWAYSIYLLHLFVVFDLARWIDAHVVALDTPVKAVAMAVPAFVTILPLAAASHHFIEQPWMRRRKNYRAG